MAEYSCVCCDLGFSIKILWGLSGMICKVSEGSKGITVNWSRIYELCPTEQAVVPPLHLAPLTVHMAGSPWSKGRLLASVVAETENSHMPTTSPCKLLL